MRLALIFLVAVLVGAFRPAAGQTPEKPQDAPDWASLLGFDRPAAQARYDDERTPEGWAWARIKRDEIADLNLRCDRSDKTRLDSRVDAGWDDACRKIPANFITDVLIVPRWRDRIGRHGLRLRGARIEGDLDLVNADIRAELGIEASRIEGKLELSRAHFAGVLSFRGSRLHGDLLADGLRADGGLSLRDGVTSKGNVKLVGARVGQNLDLSDSVFEAGIDADGLAVERSLLLGGSGFKGNLDLGGSTIGGQVDLGGARFDQGLNAKAVTVGRSVVAAGARFTRPVHLMFAHIAGGLDFSGATANHIDLSHAVIADGLTLGVSGAPLRWECAGLPPTDSDKPQSGAGWPLGDQGWRNPRCGSGGVPAMILRDAHAGALQDTAEAWPPLLDLQGFGYDGFGGITGSDEAEMRRRPAEQWRDWLDRDRVFSRQPSTQLAGILLAAGRRDTAESILYFGREQERAEAFTRKDWQGWAWLTLLRTVAGHGIGTYAFRIFDWVGGLTLFGAFILLTAPKARRRGPVWCLGASLQRLLPVVEFNRSFSDFFANPPPASEADRRNLTGWQATIFALIALLGWGLGFVLLAAISGTPAPAG